MPVILALVLSIFGFSFVSSAETSCLCQKVACAPCEMQQGVDFYTSKCGPENSQVKSCSRPKCVPRRSPTKTCPVLPGAKAQTSAMQKPIRKTAAEAPLEAAGHVQYVRGEVHLKRAGVEVPVEKNTPVTEGDAIATGANGVAIIQFHGGNRLNVHPNTRLEISEFQNPDSPELRKEFLNLINGKIRNDVEQKYNSQSSYYRVKTKAAVAGVRGTIFVIEAHQGKAFETKVETLRGDVRLASLDGREQRSVPAGHGVVLIGGDVKGQPARFTPVYTIPPERLKSLYLESRVDVTTEARTPASVSASVAASADTLCHRPSGEYNQCAWTCRNNPKGETTCRVDLPQVNCVRLRCNAGGEWAEPTRLPASVVNPANCPASGSLVKPCDY